MEEETLEFSSSFRFISVPFSGFLVLLEENPKWAGQVVTAALSEILSLS